VSAQAGERAARRRAEILDAAERVFADRGYHQAGIADIAADLGIGHGTFYRYFDNKHAIAQAVFDRVVERIGQAALEEDPESASTLAEYRSQVERLLARMFGLLDEAPALMAFLHDQSLVVDSARLSDTLDGYAAFTARFLKNGVARGYLRQDLDVEVTAQALVGVILEGTRRELRSPEQPDLRRRWIAGGVALMFDGISAREKGAAAP
jgi:AcrR family transcriptional regulator